MDLVEGLLRHRLQVVAKVADGWLLVVGEHYFHWHRFQSNHWGLVGQPSLAVGQSGDALGRRVPSMLVAVCFVSIYRHIDWGLKLKFAREPSSSNS